MQGQTRLQLDDGTLRPTSGPRYVPILQNKSGELAALKRAGTDWERMLPMICLVGPKDMRRDFKRPTLTSWTKKVSESAEDHFFFLDFLRMNLDARLEGEGGKRAVDHIYESFGTRKSNFIPVARPGDPIDHALNAAKVGLESGRGFCLRLNIGDLIVAPGKTIQTTTRDWIDEVGLHPGGVDLMIDLSYIGPEAEVNSGDIAFLLDSFAPLQEWRSITLVGSSIPKSMSAIKEGTLGTIVREEWTVWQEVSAEESALIDFGDYAIQHPLPPTDTNSAMGMRANIRYTAGGSTFVARGEGPEYQDGKEQYVGLCSSLAALPEFDGNDFSWGDSTISRCARGELDPGGQSMWRGAGTSHHLRHVARMLEPRQIPT